MDIATGNISTNTHQNYSSEGSSTTFQVKSDVPESPLAQCYVLNLLATCTADQQSSVLDGSALVHDYIVIDANTSSLFPELNGTNGNSATSSGGSGSGSGGSGTGNTTTASGSAGPKPTFTGEAALFRVGWVMIGTVVAGMSVVVL